MSKGVYRFSRRFIVISRGPRQQALRETKPLECPRGVEAIPLGKPVSEAGAPPHGPRVDRLSIPRSYLGSEGELMVRTYWFVPIFYEAIDILDLQPLARPAPSKPVVPRG